MTVIPMQQPFAVRGDRSEVARFLLVMSAIAAAFTAAVCLLPGARALQAIAVSAGGALTSASIIAFAVWIHRAYANLPHLRASSRTTPRTAAVLVVLPLFNLLASPIALYELWACSGDRRERPPALVLWPAAFNLYSIALTAALWVEPNRMIAVAALIGCAGALAGMKLILMIDARQWTRRGVTTARASASPAPRSRSASTPLPPESIPPAASPSPQS